MRAVVDPVGWKNLLDRGSRRTGWKLVWNFSVRLLNLQPSEVGHSVEFLRYI